MEKERIGVRLLFTNLFPSDIFLIRSFNEVRNANRLIIDNLIRNVSSPEVAIDFGGRERVDVMRILSDTVSW